jgi:predicted RNA-binding Zn-ribbon protein involved in translation (DUF1610 family)
MPDLSQIRFHCPACKISLTFSIQNAGKRGKCPGCGASIEAPGAPVAKLIPTVIDPGVIGVTEPICPYCDRHLDKMPGRKKKCPDCGNDIYVRTRPSDRSRILVRVDQVPIVEEQWSIANGTHEQFLATRQRRLDMTNKLRQRFGREPSSNDVEWALLTEQSLDHARDKNWGLYRNTRFALAEVLVAEDKLAPALDLLLEVCFLDLNGPSNHGAVTDPELLRLFPPFDPTSGDLAPGILARVEQAVRRLDYSNDTLKARFLTIADKLSRSLHLPLNPAKAWRVLAKEVTTKSE